ncbi:MAG TPA: protoporphyrinogen oxidase [Urbifossiella sp.]|nr:protoporphyrinogen oxidase [Urbifossiella sp.]
MPHVIVVGGGLTGLAVAYRLRAETPGVGVTVLEHQLRAGGKVGTEDINGFRVELGPNGFLDRTPHLPRLCRDLGVTDRLVAASPAARKNRYLFLGDRLRRLPGGPLGLLASPLLSARGKWQLFTEAFRKAPPPGTDETVAAFVTRRAGKEAADLFADALVTGIQAGDPEQLSVAAAFPRLPAMERAAGSLFRGFTRAGKARRREAAARGEPKPAPQQMWSFREGMGVLVDSLAESLGPAVRTGVAVRAVYPSAGVGGWTVRGDGRDSWAADAVVLAAPAYEQAGMLAELDPALADELATIPYNRVAVIALGYREADCPVKPDGFGYIAPQRTRRDVLGVQWCSSIYPGRAPAGCVLWRALCGGVNRADVLDLPDADLVRAVHAEMRATMGVTGEPVFVKLVRWPRAIPQYVVGHLDRVARIDAAASRHPGLFLTGSALRGIALGDCAEQGEAAAAAVARYLSDRSTVS